MNKGAVKWYSSQNGYGFIQPTNGSKDVLLHATALERSGIYALSEDQRVTFELQTDWRSGKTSTGRCEHGTPGSGPFRRRCIR
jgi:CspA family cold shock protein